jgi:type VI secretion system protein ImpC
MIELDVEPRGAKPDIGSDTKAQYLVLGDFGGRATEPVAVDRDNIDSVLSRLEVNLAGLRIREVEDFHPDHLYAALAQFRELDEKPPEQPSRPAPAPRADLEEILRKSSLLEQITEGGDPFQKYVQELARAHAAPVKRDDTARVTALGERMRALLHHPRFQAMEAAWRGLDFVVRNAEDDAAHIRIAQFSRGDLERDLADAADLRATRTYKLLHGRPWNGVFGLYSFGSSGANIELLGRMALIAAHARAAFVSEGSVDMGAQWEELRAIPEAKFLGLALPRFLVRLPYGARSSAVESFPFEEMPGTPVHAHLLWANPALAVLAWAARGRVEALDLEHLPVYTYQEDGDWKMQPCAEVWMTETQARALIDMGLMPLVSFREGGRARLAGVRSITGSALPLGL